MGLRSFIAKRVIYMVFLLFGVLTINFMIFELMPGDPLAMFIAPGHELTFEEQQQLMEIWGLADPPHIRYVVYVRNMLTWQFGRSFAPGHRWVSNEIMERLPNTLLLMGTSTFLSIIIGTMLGVLAAHKRGKIFDSTAVIGSLTTYALPSFWMGMVFLLVFSIRLGWFPLGGTVPREWALSWPQPYTTNILGVDIVMPSIEELLSRLHHLVLPTVTLVLFMYGGYLLLTRATMLETLTEDYILTARAKGVKERTVLFKHALKNAALPLITNAALALGFMISGAIITEQVFNWRGIGGWIWMSIQYTDYPALQAIFYVVALCVIIGNFLADLLYGIIDPRIKYG